MKKKYANLPSRGLTHEGRAARMDGLVQRSELHYIYRSQT